MHRSPGWSSRQALTRVLHCAAPRCLALQVGGGWVIVHGPPIGAAARQGPLPARAESQSLPNPSHPLFPAASRCSHPANSSPLPTSPSDLRPPRGHQKAPDFCHFLSAKLEPIVATLLRHPQGHSCDSQAVATRFSAARATLWHALELGPDRSSSRARLCSSRRLSKVLDTRLWFLPPSSPAAPRWHNTRRKGLGNTGAGNSAVISRRGRCPVVETCVAVASNTQSHTF